ncbi:MULTISPECIES: nitroreductase family protein [Peribacillus]|jgi:predicted oxidoreductase (fatty acid repression mutant protein)|uniref:nitroreductase family protein n=1 Tax=Peribacillus TaxID=2675229 RepID=UPI00070D1785|nr:MULTISPECIES: nitroreductase family protein [Peribacillus]KRF59718.1 nitroreductase [Bacillus sp. Soil745]MCP1096635.1 nitroreductase family protein [Bacillaceae bacterium OS4b]MBD8591195.1 nitroreductase family protein [Peribacillus simplex]MCM3165863.1 nitroreductase family protein [Peribacillus frigoritolerans]MCP1152841.1 nitroreductase family protein [Peribacillus frigoritolerans]
MTKDFYTAIKERRSYYGINKEVQVSDEKIKEIVEFAVKHTPSAFNSQSSRLVVLTGSAHDKLWDITTQALRKAVGEGDFSGTQQKMDSFKAGYGSILFFEDESVVKSLQEQFATYADNFPIWSQQTSGMHQLVVWTALEAEGLGATLQHYNPLIDDEVKKEWNVPSNWKLIAQMPFGNPTAQPGDKEFKPLEDRIKFYK